MPSRDVFLCHASADKATHVRPLALALSRLAVSCWVDEAEIQPGESIIDAVEAGLAEATYVVVFITSRFLRRRWPRKELNAALTREIRRGKTVVLPIVDITDAEYVKRFPLLADKLYLPWLNGIDSIASNIARRFGRKPNDEWYYFHPTKYVGSVWSRITPCDANTRRKHRVCLRWREFIKVLDVTLESSVSLVHHKMATDRMPLYVSVTPEAIVTFGQESPPDATAINIDEGWTRISGGRFPVGSGEKHGVGF